MGREWEEGGERVGRGWGEICGKRVGREWGEGGERVGRGWREGGERVERGWGEGGKRVRREWEEGEERGCIRTWRDACTYAGLSAFSCSFLLKKSSL